MAEAPDGLLDAFWAYEAALMSNDLAALDRLFAPGPDTLRGDAAGLLVGHDAISGFRSGRGGAPARRIVDVHVRQIGPINAVVVAITELLTGGRGQQTQVWERQADGWKVTAAHVAVGAPAFDRRVWRVVGDPLLPPTAPGPLDGETVAVKDLFAVAGQRVGAGNPAWLEQATVEPADASAVASLRAAGAAIRGIARTEEFAYSLTGVNAHYGTPPNPRAPHRISGGSTSGSASAVSMGHATIGLGTDTGGSIRVPGAYQGLWGIRPTHGVVSVDGLLPLAPSFDTVGWLTREPALLATVGAVLLPEDGARPAAIVAPEPLLRHADPDIRDAIDGIDVPTVGWDTDATWLPAFRTLQAWEAWQSNGAWLESRLDVLGPDVRTRFEQAATISDEDADEARAVVRDARARIREAVADRAFLLPGASSVAPLLGSSTDAVRAATMELTCVAGLGGLPAVVMPLTTRDGLPAAACLVGPAGSDQSLIALATTFVGHIGGN